MSRIVGPDGAEMRNFILSQLDWNEVDRVLDVGCGVGYDLFQIGERILERNAAAKKQPNAEKQAVAPTLCGVDVQKENIDLAQANQLKDERYEFRVHDFSKEALPYPDNYFDVVYTHNVLECSTDKNVFLTELHRVLKPGGQILCAHFDWDSAFYNGSNKELIRKVIHAYADWQQDWMDACDGWMGRKLWGTLQGSDLFLDAKLLTYQIVNTKYEFPYYGFKSVEGYAEMVPKGLITAAEYRDFTAEMDAMARSGNYLFCITTFVYLAHK